MRVKWIINNRNFKLVRERIMKIKIDDLAKRENVLPCTRKLQYFTLRESRGGMT